MIKLILIIFIIVCSVLIGIGIKNHLQNRLDIFRDFKDLIKNISGEITFLKTDKYTMLKNQHLSQMMAIVKYLKAQPRKILDEHTMTLLSLK